MRAASLLLALCACASLLLACETQVQLGDLPPCNAMNCDGCCNLGECVPAALQTVDRCGKGGNRCIACPGGSGATCAEGACFQSLCGPCAGCCWSGICRNDTNEFRCGRFGQACGECDTRADCVQGVCTTCGPQNCAGCCDFFGDCVAGDSRNNCGTGGASCDNCGLDSCVGGACR